MRSGYLSCLSWLVQSCFDKTRAKLFQRRNLLPHLCWTVASSICGVGDPQKSMKSIQLIWILENGLKRVGENSRWQAVPVWNLRISRIMVKELHVAVVDAIFGPRLLRDTAGYVGLGANWSSTDGQLSYKGVPQMPCCPWLWVLLWCFVWIAGSHYRRSRWSPSSWEPVLSPGLWSTPWLAWTRWQNHEDVPRHHIWKWSVHHKEWLQSIIRWYAWPRCVSFGWYWKGQETWQFYRGGGGEAWKDQENRFAKSPDAYVLEQPRLRLSLGSSTLWNGAFWSNRDLRLRSRPNPSHVLHHVKYPE